MFPQWRVRSGRVVKIRYAELPDGMHAQVQGSGRQTVIYLAPGLSPGQRAAARRRLIRASRSGHGPRLRRPAVSLAVARDNLRTTLRNGATAARCHPAGSLLIAGLLTAAVVCYAVFVSVTIRLNPGPSGRAGCPGHPAGHPRERGPAARVWAGPPRRAVRRPGRRARCLLGRGALPGRLRAEHRGRAVTARGQPNATGHHLGIAALAERAAALLGLGPGPGPRAGLSVRPGSRPRPGLLVAVRPSRWCLRHGGTPGCLCLRVACQAG